MERCSRCHSAADEGKGRVQTERREAVMEMYSRELCAPTAFVVCTRLGLEELGSEIRPTGQVSSVKYVVLPYLNM